MVVSRRTAGFYFLRPLLGYSALFVMFFVLWIGPRIA